MKRIILLALLLTMAVCGCSNKSGSTVGSSKDEVISDSVIIETGTMVPSYLTGKPVDEAIGRQRPIAVMFNNQKKGCPQTGISRADVVYEAPVEGRITRLMGVIEDWHDLAKIGSVRSCRDYFASFALEFDAIYVHFGQAVYAEDMINSDLVDNISGAVKGVDRPARNAFYRTSDRKAPHNVYVSAEGIMKDIEKFEYSLNYDDEYYGKFKFAKEGETPDYSKYPDATLIYPGGEKSDKGNGYARIGAYFEYNEKDGKYYRYQYDGKHIDDMNGEQLAYDNVIFQYCYGEVHDKSDDYFAFECFGSDKSNKSIVFMDGKMIEGTWWRDGSNISPAKYLDENGDRVVLNQGKTWVCIIWSDYADDVVIE